MRILLKSRGKFESNYPPDYVITRLRVIQSASKYFDEVETKKERCINGNPIVGNQPYHDGYKEAMEKITGKLQSTPGITDVEGQQLVAVLKRGCDFSAPSTSSASPPSWAVAHTSSAQPQDIRAIAHTSSAPPPDNQAMDGSADVGPTDDVEEEFDEEPEEESDGESDEESDEEIEVD